MTEDEMEWGFGAPRRDLGTDKVAFACEWFGFGAAIGMFCAAIVLSFNH